MKLQFLKKPLVLIVVIVVLVCAFLFMGFSAINPEINTEDIATIEECTNAARVWLSLNYSDGTQIGEVVPILAGDKTVAYCFNFTLEDKPNGYVVIDADKNSGECFKEFVLSGKGIYETLAESYAESNGIDISENTEKKIFSTGAFEYAIPTNKNDCYTSNNRKFRIEKIKELSRQFREVIKSYRKAPTSEIEFREGFYYGKNLGTAISEYGNLPSIDSFEPSIMSSLRPGSSIVGLVVNTGNCSVTAATNLLSYYAEKRGFTNLLVENSRQLTYNEIVKRSEFKTYLPSGSTEQVGVSNAKMNSTISKYVKDKEYKYSSSMYWLNLWTDWKRDIGYGYPVYTYLEGSTKLDGNWVKTAHAVIAVGFREYSSGEKYLRVLDGWNRSNDRYIYFNSKYFTVKNGIAMKVK